MAQPLPLDDTSDLAQTIKDAWREDCPRCALPMGRDLTGSYPVFVCARCVTRWVRPW